MVHSYPLFAAVAGSTALLAGASAAFEKHNKLQGRSSSYGWKIKDDWTGERIYQEWEYNVASVDNEGVAQYVSRDDAVSLGMTGVNGSFYSGVDTTKWVSGQRSAVKVSSPVNYNVGTLVLADVAHAPDVCGVWPALWMVSQTATWPEGGEIDINEYTHYATQNSFSVHTSSGCKMQTSQTSKLYSGTQMLTGSTGLNCDADATADSGCGIRDKSTSSAGAGSNAIGGGVYAMSWTTSAIQMWFFPRDSIPSDISSGKPTQSGWGTPTFRLTNDGCDLSKHFYDLGIILNIDLCGTWAGNDWNSDMSYCGQDGSCADKTGYSSCAEYVQANGDAFHEAYWEINSIKVYEQE